VLAGEATWARRHDGARLARQVLAKAQRLPGVDEVDQLRVLVCAREELENVPTDVLGITAHDILALP